MQPLVSVIMPCLDCADTLALALASLLAQTYQNWEAIIVDDGSTQPIRSVLSKFDDARVKYVRLKCNQGRGYARQVALSEAQGDFLAILDADDWYYPWKLQNQLEYFAKYPEAVLVAPGLAVVNKDNELVGVRGTADSGGIRVCPALRKLASVTIVHAPIMTRMAVAKLVGYDHKFRISEDEEFLLKVTQQGPHVIVPDVLYVYSEIESQSLKKQLQSYRATRKIFLKHLGESPVTAVRQIVATWIKAAVYVGAYSVGLGKALVARRSQRPTEMQVQEFWRARKAVLERLSEVEA